MADRRTGDSTKLIPDPPANARPSSNSPPPPTHPVRSLTVAARRTPMNLPRASVKRPVFTTMVTLIVIVLGVVSLTRLRTDLLPNS